MAPGGGERDFEFDPKLRPRYAPEYLSQSEYDELLQANAARRAVVEAAKLPHTPAAKELVYEFDGTDEPKLKRALTDAQKQVARLEPSLQARYARLEPGQRDRAKLTRPRWRAAYDLAWGRALAARARVEGYNAVLAQLKLGRKFAREGSTLWVLSPSDSLEVGTEYENLVRGAKTTLQRVIDEHPGTPWARLAQLELQAKLGWEWTER